MRQTTAGQLGGDRGGESDDRTTLAGQMGSPEPDDLRAGECEHGVVLGGWCRACAEEAEKK